MKITINNQVLNFQHSNITKACIKLKKGTKMKEWIQFFKFSITNLEINKNKEEYKVNQLGLVS